MAIFQSFYHYMQKNKTYLIVIANRYFITHFTHTKVTLGLYLTNVSSRLDTWYSILNSVLKRIAIFKLTIQINCVTHFIVFMSIRQNEDRVFNWGILPFQKKVVIFDRCLNKKSWLSWKTCMTQIIWQKNLIDLILVVQHMLM